MSAGSHALAAPRRHATADSQLFLSGWTARRDHRIQEFRAHELLVNYKKTILVAVEEVDNAVKQCRALLERQHALGTALDQSRRAVDLATERYERRLTDFLTVLDAQRQEFELEHQYVIAQQVAAGEFVFLYKALGGGWELYQDLPPIPEPALVWATFRRLSARIPWN